MHVFHSITAIKQSFRSTPYFRSSSVAWDKPAAGKHFFYYLIWWRLFQLITTSKRLTSQIIRTKLLFFLIIDVTLVCWKPCTREMGFKSCFNILLLCFSFSILTTALNEERFVFPYMDHNKGFSLIRYLMLMPQTAKKYRETFES